MKTQNHPATRAKTASPVGDRPDLPRKAAHPQPNAAEIKPGQMDHGVVHLRDGAVRRPTRDQIERRAYDIWLRRAGGDGNPTVDWLQAERELLSEINARNAD